LRSYLRAMRCAWSSFTPEKSGTVRRAPWRVPTCMTMWAATAIARMIAPISTRLYASRFFRSRFQ
jgi:hypothetical protein